MKKLQSYASPLSAFVAIKKTQQKAFVKTISSAALMLALSEANAVAPLSVSGNQVLAGGQHASFAGMSLFESCNGWGGDRFYNAGTVQWLKNDWKANIVRAAMCVENSGGYLQDPNGNKAKVRAVVDAAIANDMYVIIDFHSHAAQNYRNQAIAFFQEMARTYGGRPNVIYEIYNEPLNTTSWSGAIKPYAQAVIGAIRAIDPDNLIIVGTPTWSQDVDVASRDRLSGNNIAYTLHFYAATHKQFLRDKAQTALNNGIALFVTEWGTVEASGDGWVDQSETYAWVDFMKKNNISNANWALNDKREGASALTPGASGTGGWTNNQITQSGALVRSIIQGWPHAAGGGGGGNTGGGNGGFSMLIQAENATYQSGTKNEATSDAGGGLDVGYIESGDWLSYSGIDVNVPSSGNYNVEFRVASLNGGGNFSFEEAGGNPSYTNVSVPKTGGWQNWVSVNKTITLNAGTHHFGIGAKSAGWNINWFRITKQ